MVQVHDPFNLVRRTLEKSVTQLFSWHGKIVGKYPWPFFVIPIIITIVCACGFTRFTEENDILESFTPKGAESRYEIWVKNHFFKKNVPLALNGSKRTKREINIEDRFGVQTVHMAMELRDEGDIYGPRISWVLSTIDYFYNKLQIEHNGEMYRYQNFCNPFCPFNERAKIFLEMLKDSYDNKSPHVKLLYPTIEVFGNSFYIGDNIFGVKINKTNGYITSFKMVNIILLYKKTKENIGYVKKWERAAVSKIMKNNVRHLNLVTGHPNGVFAEVKRTGMAAVPYLLPCVLILLVFSILSNLKSDCRRSNIWESVAGLLCPIMAIITTFGILLYCGLPYQHVVSITLFLVIEVGVDDMYIMLHTWHRTDPHLSVSDRMSLAIAHCGPSITITSATNALSFAVGIFTPTPAIQTFCSYTALSITMDYIFQITYFAAVMTFSGHREAANRNSFICCLSQGDDNFKVNVFEWLGKKYSQIIDISSKILVTNKARVIILFTMIVYVSIAIYGIVQTTIEISIRKIVLDDSPLHRVEYFRKKYFLMEANEIRIFVQNPGNFENRATRQKSIDFVEAFESFPQYVNGSTSFWLRPYKEYLEFFDDDEDFFSYRYINSFIDTANNNFWKQHLVYDHKLCTKHNCVYKWSFTVTYRDLAVWYERAEMYKQLRKLVKRPEFITFNASIFSWTNYGADQIGPVISTTKNLILLTLLFMVVVCFFFVPNLTSIICAVLCVISMNLGIFGYLMLWNVDMDPISMAALLMAVGFSVDYTAHMSYHYFKSTKENPEDRLAEAYNSIAWPMIQAAVSTLICPCVMTLHHSYMIRTFVKTIVLVIVLGLAHGLIILPVMLTSIQVFKNRRSERKNSADQLSDGCTVAEVKKRSEDRISEPNGIVIGSWPINADEIYIYSTNIDGRERLMIYII